MSFEIPSAVSGQDHASNRLIALFSNGVIQQPPRTSAMQESLSEDGYCILRGVLSQALWSTVSRYALQRERAGRMMTDVHVPGIPSCYGDPLTEELLCRMQPLVEAVNGQPIHPTYSFFRIYNSGDSLFRHRDRDACEVSVSVNLGDTSDTPWPLWIEGKHGREVPVALGPGDALIYKGVECMHWREPLAAGQCIQAFLHYVNALGPYAQLRFDGRQGIRRLQAQTA